MVDTLPSNSRLPPELLGMVKEFIPIADLRTHVCFYNTCRMVASLYGKTPEEEEAFWKKSCTLCGICLVNDESWKAVAFECISQDGFCSHPACGGALLEWNAEQVASAMKRVSQWKPEKVLNAATLGLQEEDYERDEILPEETFTAHNIFEYLAFSAPGSAEAGDATLDVVLQHPTARLTKPLCKHPLARRSVATFPSLSHVLYWGEMLNDSQIVPEGGLGTPITVWDVHGMFRKEVNRSYDLSYGDLMETVGGGYLFLLDEEGKLRRMTAPSGELMVCEDDGEQKTYREIWSRCKITIVPGHAYVGDLEDLTVRLRVLLSERQGDSDKAAA